VSLLAELEQNQTSLKRVAEHANIDFSCDIWGDDGFGLSPELLSQIADIGAYLNTSVNAISEADDKE